MSDVELSRRTKEVRAVAYLFGKSDLWPDNLVHLFKKIESYRINGVRIEETEKKAIESLNELRVEKQKLAGSINAVTEIIAEQLTDEQIEEYSQKIVVPPEG